MVVGKFVGDAAQAAVSSTGMLRSLMIALLSGFAQGVNVRMAQCVGAKDNEEAGPCRHHTLLSCGMDRYRNGAEDSPAVVTAAAFG